MGAARVPLPLGPSAASAPDLVQAPIASKSVTIILVADRIVLGIVLMVDLGRVERCALNVPLRFSRSNGMLPDGSVACSNRTLNAAGLTLPSQNCSGSPIAATVAAAVGADSAKMRVHAPTRDNPLSASK